MKVPLFRNSENHASRMLSPGSSFRAKSLRLNGIQSLAGHQHHICAGLQSEMRRHPVQQRPLSISSITAFNKAISKLLPAERRLTDADSLHTYGRDWSRFAEPAPSLVLLPDSVEQVVAIVKAAHQFRVPLVPSGGRTGLSGGAVAAHGEVVLSLEKMNRILDFNAGDRTLRCQAGTVTGQIQAFAKEHGLFYPVDFASSGSSQIGGNIATNAGGIKVLKYGLTRSWVSGLTVVTGTGKLLNLNHGLVKNATGYDWRHLFVGSEGTLGVIVEAQLQLTRAPLESQALVLGVPDLAALMQVFQYFSKQIDLSAFEFFLPPRCKKY